MKEKGSKEEEKPGKKRNEIASLQSPLSFLCPYQKKRERIDIQTARTKKIVTKEREMIVISL